MSEVSTRLVGRIEVRAYSAGTLAFSISRYMDENPVAVAEASANNGGRATLGTNFLHVRTGGVSMLIDPGGWSQEHVRRLDDLRPVSIDDNLDLLGLDPAEVTDVVVSHGHPDHFLGIFSGDRLRFPNARHHLHHRDLDGDGLPERDYVEVKAAFGLARDAGLLRPVDAAEAEIVEGVTMIHTGGESGGHCVVRISDGADTLFYLADLIHLPAEAHHLTWAMRNRNTAELASGRRRVFGEAEKRNAIVIYTHDHIEPPWARVVADGDGWRLQRVG